MTDITELAQREKFEAWAEEVGALPWGILKKHRNQDGSYPGPHYTYMWKAWQAASAELVEALEKAQAGEKQWREVVDAFCADDADWHKLTNSNNELIALLSQALCKQADRIAELESRSVKLPAERFCPAEYAGSQLWSETEVWNKAITACADELRASGIKVEAE
ncbi:TPA: hypothetical protein NY230_004004 [Klebsiella michiganensis]|nr:hypothetical protein [Klebsiella michiganensis]